MIFSKDPNYRAYGAYTAARNYPAARSALELCLATPTIKPMQKTLLLQFIGKSYFYENNIEQALRYFELSEQAGWASLMPYLSAAKFFTEWLKDYDRAISKCNQIILIATVSPTEKTEDDESSAYYLAKAEELKQFCYTKKMDT